MATKQYQYDFTITHKKRGNSRVEQGVGATYQEALRDLQERYRNYNIAFEPDTRPNGQYVETKTYSAGKRQYGHAIIPVDEAPGRRITDNRSAQDIANEKAYSAAYKASGVRRNEGESIEQYMTRVPTVAGQGMNGVGTTNIPTPKYQSGNITGASASVAGLGSYYDTLTKQMEDDRKRADELQAQQAKDQKGIMSLLKKQPSQAEIREDAYNDIGVDPADYFAKQKAGITEIEALTKDYNAVKAARDQQIAATNDKLGSMNFINNQIAQIERNSAPKLNEISANINSKSATLQALQGNFAEARSFVNQAVDDATANLKFQLDLFTMFYDMNQDNLNRLETRYQNSFNTALSIAEKQYDDARADKTAVAELMLKWYESGITINDTLDQALAKAVASGADPQTALANANTAADNARLNREDGGGTSSVSTYAQAYLDDQIEITSVPEKLRAQVLAEANRIATATLNAPTPVPTQSSRGTLSYLPGAMVETTKNFFSSLFGN